MENKTQTVEETKNKLYNFLVSVTLDFDDGTLDIDKKVEELNSQIQQSNEDYALEFVRHLVEENTVGDVVDEVLNLPYIEYELEQFNSLKREKEKQHE